MRVMDQNGKLDTWDSGLLYENALFRGSSRNLQQFPSSLHIHPAKLLWTIDLSEKHSDAPTRVLTCTLCKILLSSRKLNQQHFELV